MEENKYITIKDIIGYVGDGDSSTVFIPKNTILTLFYFDQYCMQFKTENIPSVVLDRVDPYPEEPCNYAKYYTLADGIKRI